MALITDTIERLRATAMPPLVKVEGAEALEALGAGTAPRHGSAYVAPFEERGSPNSLATGGTRQHVDVILLVAVVLRMADDARGAKRVSSVDEFSQAIETALAGWTPGDDHIPFEFVAARSRPTGENKGVTWYVQTWRSSRFISSEA